jgi:CHAT domain-containing protein/tetratricopeptide (TPR) repeat protein
MIELRCRFCGVGCRTELTTLSSGEVRADTKVFAADGASEGRVSREMLAWALVLARTSFDEYERDRGVELIRTEPEIGAAYTPARPDIDAEPEAPPKVSFGQAADDAESLPAEVTATLQKAYLAMEADEYERSADLWRQALLMLSASEQPRMRAFVEGQVGFCLAALAEQTGSTDLRHEAIAALERARAGFTPQRHPVQWATLIRASGLVRVRIGSRAALEAALDELRQVLDHSALPNVPPDIVAGVEEVLDEARWCLAALLAEGDEYPERAIGLLEEFVASRHAREVRPDDWGDAWNRMGVLHARMHDDRARHLDRAIECFSRAQDVYTRESHAEDWAMCKLNLGAAHADRLEWAAAEHPEDADLAIASLHEAGQVYTREAWPREWASLQALLGCVYADRQRVDGSRDLDMAVDHLQSALQVITQTSDPAQWARLTHNLGIAHLRRGRVGIGDRAGDLEQAIECLAASAEGQRAGSVEWATTMSHLGLAYLERVDEDWRDAIGGANLQHASDCMEAALAVLTREIHPAEFAGTQLNLAGVYLKWGQPDRATEHLRAALEVGSTTEGWSSENRAMVENDLGVACLDQNDAGGCQHVEEAIDWFQRALTTRTRQALPNEWATTQANLARAYLRRQEGDPAENLERGIAAYWSALQVRTPLAGPGECRRIAGELARASFQAGRWMDAADACRLALDANDRLVDAAPLMSAKEAELSVDTDLPARFAYAAARAAEGNGASERLLEAASRLERSRARLLRERLASDQAELEAVASSDPAAFQAFQAAVRRLRDLEATERVERGLRIPLQDRDRSGPAGPPRPAADAAQAARALVEDPGGRARRRFREMAAAEMQRAREDLEEVTERIRRLPGHEGFRSARSGLQDVVEAAIDGVPLAYVACTPAGSVSLLVRRDPTAGVVAEPVFAELTEDELNRMLYLMPGDPTTGYLGTRHVAELSPQLARWLETSLAVVGRRLIAPLADRLAELGASGVVLLPVGPLGALPLHCAPHREPGDPGQRRLIEDLDVSFVPSASVLVQGRRALDGRTGRRPRLVGVGDPQRPGQPASPVARAELERIAAHFPEEGRVLLCDQEASRSRLIEAAADASHVHLSCHGDFHPWAPLTSPLQLAGRDELTLMDLLVQMPFGTARLVVASACQTGTTDVLRAPDEAVSLTSGFLQAGTPGVLATLWSVNALSTAILMERFYVNHLHGNTATREGPMSPARALRRAQAWMAAIGAEQLEPCLDAHPAYFAVARSLWPGRSDDDVVTLLAELFRRPYFWAGFIHAGV